VSFRCFVEALASNSFASPRYNISLQRFVVAQQQRSRESLGRPFREAQPCHSTEAARQRSAWVWSVSRETTRQRSAEAWSVMLYWNADAPRRSRFPFAGTTKRFIASASQRRVAETTMQRIVASPLRHNYDALKRW